MADVQSFLTGNDDDRQTLVVVFLRGGADGLNLVAPLEDDGYYRSRPRIAIGKKDCVKLDDFYGMNPKALRAEFRKSLQVFLAVCAEKGLDPRRQFSGKFNLRISPELHERLAIVAQAEGKSINLVAQEALQQRVTA